MGNQLFYSLNDYPVIVQIDKGIIYEFFTTLAFLVLYHNISTQSKMIYRYSKVLAYEPAGLPSIGPLL